MTHKLFTLLSLILIAVFALGGCAAPATSVPTSLPPTQAPVVAAPTQPAPTQPPPEPTATEVPPEPTATELPKVTITWWHIQVADDQKALWQQMADDYMKEHPNITIEITVLENEAFKTKLTTVMQSGNPPDIFQSWGGGTMNEYAQAGLLKDITADLEKDGWKDTFSPGALGVYSYLGKYYGVPRDMGAVGFWYNKDLFAKAGIEATPTTWTELLEDVKKLKAAGIVPIALGEGDKWPGGFWWEYLAVRIGGKAAFDAAYSHQGAFTDPPFVEAGKKLQELIALKPFQDGFLGSSWPDEQVVMATSKAAMDLMGQWAPGAFKDSSVDKQGLGDKLGWFPFPAVEGGAGDINDALGGGNGFAIGKNAPDAAVDFVKYMLDVKQQTRMAEKGLAVPVIKGAEAGLTDPLMIGLVQQLAKAKYFQLYYDQYLPPAVGEVIKDNMQALFAGSITPEECMQAIEDSVKTEVG
jgi:raffinose/stachyose/melibiose transport system substrate-binding protein